MIDFIQTEEGRAVPSGSTYNYEYMLKDHLGNTRVTVKQDGSIVQVQDYYAFGKEMNPGNMHAGSPANQYKYNGKEKHEELEEYDYGARFYDPVVGRWKVVDNKAELYFSYSTYIYAGNTPNNAIDPDGNLIIFVAGQNLGDGDSPSYWRGTRNVTTTSIVGFNGSTWSQTLTIPTQIDFAGAVMTHFNDRKAEYYDGGLRGWANTASATTNGIPNNLSLENRQIAGHVAGKREVARLIKNLARTGGVITESIKVIAHSMGAAYAKAFIEEIIAYAKAHPEECRGLSITEYDFAAFQQNRLSAISGVPLYQFDNEGDSVVDGFIGWVNDSKHKKQKGATGYESNVNPDGGHSILDFIDAVSKLEPGRYLYVDGTFVKQ